MYVQQTALQLLNFVVWVNHKNIQL